MRFVDRFIVLNVEIILKSIWLMLVLVICEIMMVDSVMMVVF